MHGPGRDKRIGLEPSGVRNRSRRGGAGKRRDVRGGASYWGRSGGLDGLLSGDDDVHGCGNNAPTVSPLANWTATCAAAGRAADPLHPCLPSD
jgi:hypothetical protein